MKLWPTSKRGMSCCLFFLALLMLAVLGFESEKPKTRDLWVLSAEMPQLPPLTALLSSVQRRDEAQQAQQGDYVKVVSPACYPIRSKHLPQNPCCERTGCCEDGKAKVVDGRNVTWTSDTELVIVAPLVTNRKHHRRDSKRSNLSWITNQSIFPHVLCPYCTVERQPLCAVKTHQGFEASVYLAFIVYNFDRLPRTVAFVHGHPWIQHHKAPIAGCTNWARLLRLRPFLNEDIFVYLQGSSWFGRVNLTNSKPIWENVLGLPFPDVQASTFHVGPHIVVGRNKIRSRPKELYERLFAYARGDDYPGSDLSVDEDGKAFGNGHIAAGDFSLEIWWNLIFNQNQSWQHPDDPKGLRCKLGWCHDKQC